MEKTLGEVDRTGTVQPPDPPSLAADTMSAAESLYVEHGPLMRRVAFRRFKVPYAIADELVQDVFVNYLVSQSKVHTNVRSYLIASIANACRNYWRAQQSAGKVFEDGDTDAAVSLERDIFEGLATQLAVASTLAKLPARCREALRRYYLHEEDTTSIAAAMDTSSANVNYLMHKCRKRAREIYETMTRVADHG
jgi:RNA polymerase sigma factor (sigma-70 family)